MSRPINVRLDGAALRHNHALVRQTAPHAKVWSVIKANAYGHGVLRAAKALQSVADGFAVVEVEQAIALRQAGIRQPVLLLEGFYQANELPLFAQWQLTPVLHTLWQVDVLIASQWQLPVYLKIDTGMNRLGFTAKEFSTVLTRLESAGCAASITVMTHFADADEDRGIAEQMSCLRTMTNGHALPLSLANSAALLRFPESHADWVRPGIMLYGASPFPARQSAEALGLKPVMTLASELIGVRDIAAGDRVGYGGTFVAEQPMRIGIVACGYADGYPRHAPTGTPVLVAGQRTRTLGRVSMDKLCVDLTGIEQKLGAGKTTALQGGRAKNALLAVADGDTATTSTIGTKVTLWGEGLPADDVATAAGTVAYELFCAVTPRVPVVEVNIDVNQ
ncbi:MAG: alanine racemase [Rugosibacter sp.]